MAKSRRPSQPFEPTPSRRYFGRTPHDPRFRSPPEFIERIGFMANPKEWLVPTSLRKPQEVADMVTEMRQKGLVRVTVDKNMRTRVTPTRYANGLHLLTRYCLSRKPFARLPVEVRGELIQVYLATIIRDYDYNPATKKYDTGKPIFLENIRARIKLESDITRLERNFRSFGNPKDWDPLTKQYYHYLAQRAAIALAADEYLTKKRWDAFMSLRSIGKFVGLFPNLPWGRKNEP